MQRFTELIGLLNFLRVQFRDASLHLIALDSQKVTTVRRSGWSG
jgi:hypothetical protein